MSDKKRLKKNRYKNSQAKEAEKRRHRVWSFLKIIGAGCLIGVMSSAFTFCYDFLTQCDYFDAREINIEGESKLTEDQIVQQANVELGKNILSLNLSVIRRRLLTFQWIADAEVRRELPSTIHIRIKEQNAVAVLDLGREYLMNESGEVFKILEPSDDKLIAGGVVFIRGLDYSDISDPGEPKSPTFAAVMDVLQVGYQNNGGVTSIKRVDVDREIGLTLHLSDRITKVNIGYNDYPLKYQKLKNILLHLDQQPEEMEIGVIDLKNLDRIVVKPNITQQPTNQKEV